MDEDLLRAKRLQPTSAVMGYVDDYQLRIGARATLVKKSGCRAYGLIADLRDDELSSLYSDPAVADYKPVVMQANALSGSAREVVSYLLPVHALSGTNPEYALKLAAVAARLGVPEAYVREIESWST